MREPLDPAFAGMTIVRENTLRRFGCNGNPPGSIPSSHAKARRAHPAAQCFIHQTVDLSAQIYPRNAGPRHTPPVLPLRGAGLKTGLSSEEETAPEEAVRAWARDCRAEIPRRN